jgi:branched-chain amino acid transport system substrate-binding protein
MKTRLLFCSIILIGMMCTFAVGAMAAPAAPQTIPVGAAISLSGPWSNLGTQTKAGYEVAIEDVNRAGGIFVKEYGKKIPLELVVQDTESVPAKAVSRMEWLYSSRKVVAYVGTPDLVYGQGIGEKNRVPLLPTISLHQQPHDQGLKYYFALSGKSPDIPRFAFDLLGSVPADKRPQIVAIFQEQSNWGVEQAEAFRKEALQRNYKVPVFEKYAMMTKDFSPLIMAAKNAGADVLISTPIAPDAMTMMRQMKELDYSPKANAIIRGAEDLSWAKAMGSVGDYVIITGCWHHSVKFPGVDKFNAAYQAKFGRQAEVTAGPAYASIQVLAAAIERAGTLDPTKIRDAIAATDMMTVLGKVKFRPNGTNMEPYPAVVQWQGGVQRLVWPQESRDASFVYPIPQWKDR